MPSRVLRVAAMLACSVPIASCANTGKTKSLAKAKTAVPSKTPAPGKGTESQRGIASIYNDHRTASGERFKAASLCAAHRTLPFGSRVKVTCTGTGRSTIVRIIDLTPGAAAEIGLTQGRGLASVEVSPVLD
jgi:rare lipoprotein A